MLSEMRSRCSIQQINDIWKKNSEWQVIQLCNHINPLSLFSIKDLLQNMGDNFTAEEVIPIDLIGWDLCSNSQLRLNIVKPVLLKSVLQIRQTWKEAPIKEGKLDYDQFVTLIKRGNQDI